MGKFWGWAKKILQALFRLHDAGLINEKPSIPLEKPK